ncbi:MGDG synthase family glycosyltransferase [Paenibacillus harenae]|uniref:MGDG synthase family glycosyltransferase n=1 Tax=Paenibacillus harenae TaxID=306543 RepID=UPI00040D768C|nr:glycosyltransferase [Paenibacillus harenae]
MEAAQKEKILILSGALGDGHVQAAKALYEAAGLYHSDAEVEVIDFMKWTHPRLSALGSYCYLKWIKHFPSVYGYLFQKTRMDNPYSHFLKQLQLFNLEKMRKLLQKVQPSIVVHTFPSSAAAMSLLKSYGLTDLPSVTVITDHTDHSYWIHPHTDHYLVSSEDVRQLLILRNISERQITVSGIPIRESFSQSFDKQLLRAHYGIGGSQFVVLVMGGGLGMIDSELVEWLQNQELPPAMQFIVICGRNKKLQQGLSKKLSGRKERVTIAGYVDHIQELMALSDLVLTKPGGLTTSEALAMELPMLLFKPLPGQEQDNARYLVRREAALEANDFRQLQLQLMRLYHDRELLGKMKEKAKQCSVKQSARYALGKINELNNHYRHLEEEPFQASLANEFERLELCR